MFTKEEMHADQAEFRLLVLISNYARDPWRRSLTSQTDHWGEWRMRHVFTINRSTTKMPRKCAAVWCAQLQTKGSLFSFHTFPKDSSRRKLHPWRFELEIVPSRLPCGHPHRHDFFTGGYRSRIAQLSLGRWKERSLRMKPPSLPILQGIYPDRPKDSEIHFDTLNWHPVQILKLKKGKTFFTRMNTQILSKNELVINAEEEEEGRERKQKTNGHGKHGEKEKQEVQLLNYPPKKPCLV